jgi:hypothetical protein
MYVRTSSDRTARPYTLDDIGVPSGEHEIVTLTELFIGREPKSAARMSRRSTCIKLRKARYEVTNCFQTDDARLPRFI